MKFTEMIDEYRRACQHTQMARTSIGAVFMPTNFMMSILKNKKEPPITTTAEAAESVDIVMDDYEVLFKAPAEIVDKYPGNTPDDTFDIMDAFTRITQLPSKVGDMVFLCTCVYVYQNFRSIHASRRSSTIHSQLVYPGHGTGHAGEGPQV